MDEVENAVILWIQAGNKARPRHRTLRRRTSLQRRKTPAPGQGLKVGHPALGHQRPQNLRIHAVDAQH